MKDDIIDLVQGPDGVYVQDKAQKQNVKKQTARKKPGKTQMTRSTVLNSIMLPGEITIPQGSILDEILVGFDIGMEFINKINRLMKIR